MALSILGIITALVLASFLAYKGKTPILIGPIAAFVICLGGGIGFDEFISSFASGYGAMCGSLFFTYLFAMVFSELLVAGKGAYSIAYWLADHFGSEHVTTVCALAGIILTVGGMSSSAYIVVLPIGLVLCSKSNYSRDILPAACMFGAWTIIACPLVPSVHNALIMNALGTDAAAGLVPGLVGGIVLIGLGVIYLEWQARKWRRSGRGFVEGRDEIPEDTPEARADFPPLYRAFLPLVFVLAAYNLLHLPIYSSLAIGCAACTLLEIRTLKSEWFGVWEKGTLQSLTPTCCTAAMAGIGTAVTLTPAFQGLVELIGNSDMNPYILAPVSSALMALCLGSASSALATAVPVVEPFFTNAALQGYSLGNIHRLMVFASVGLDSMPQSGAVAGALSLMKTTHKESYFPVFITTVVLTNFVTFCVILPLVLLGF